MLNGGDAEGNMSAETKKREFKALQLNNDNSEFHFTPFINKIRKKKINSIENQQDSSSESVEYVYKDNNVKNNIKNRKLKIIKFP